MPDEISLIPKDYKGQLGAKTIFSKVGILALVLVILTLLIYGGLNFYGQSLDKQLNDIKSQLEETNKQRDVAFEKEVISLEKSLKNLKILLKNHIYWSDFFAKLENLVVPQVSFSNFKAEFKDDKSINLTLKGRTSSYTQLAKQMASFGQEPLVSDITVSGITIGAQGGVEFTLNINLLKDVFLKK